MSLTKEQADYIRSLGYGSRSHGGRAKELFPEVFEPERINLVAANNGNINFMDEILLRAGLQNGDIQFISGTYDGQCNDGEGFFISKNLLVDLKPLLSGSHILILKRAKK